MKKHKPDETVITLRYYFDEIKQCLEERSEGTGKVITDEHVYNCARIIQGDNAGTIGEIMGEYFQSYVDQYIEAEPILVQAIKENIKIRKEK